MDKARFLENLTKERKKRSLTQKELADALGISDKTYSKWETGENEPDIETLCRLAAYYGGSPAIFFPEEEPAPPAGLPLEKAAESCWRRACELILSLHASSSIRPEAPLPVPEMPEVLGEKGMDPERSLWHYAVRDVMALLAAGKDGNLALLMLPHEERYRWLLTEGEALEGLFRLLGMPGAARCLYGMLTAEEGSLFSPAWLAQQTGITAEEATAFLAEAAPWDFCQETPYIREQGAARVYTGMLRVQLMGLLSLGRILLSDDARRGEKRDLWTAGWGGVRLPKEEEA
ncbi:MAG: helix-turn-helix transcriptional regulator [Oscillospiraceae bacterium]|nr:helix-turn-helix transcriptional regulator [Oscillospiraceae bacterium]